MQNKIIEPTVGRRVWLVIANPPAGLAFKPGQPLDAGIAAVHNDRLVNISFADAAGRMHNRENVVLVQEGDTEPAGDFCRWMPFQAGQAKAPALTASDLAPLVARIEALEAQLGELKVPTPPTETKTYADGTTAIGPVPLPEQSPAEQEAAAPAAKSKKASTTSKPPIKNA